MPDEHKETEAGPGGPQSFYELYSKHMESVRDAHAEAYKRLEAAYAKYADAIQSGLREISQQACAQMYVDGLQAAMGRADAAQRYLHTSHDAALAFQRRASEAGRALMSELTNVGSGMQAAQKEQYENFLSSIQDMVSKMDIKSMDPTTVARIGHGILTAAYLRAVHA